MTVVLLFILLNSKEFTVKAENNLVNYDLIQLLERTPSSRFDWEKNMWIFDLKVHEILAVALTNSGYYVRALPREVIAALQINGISSTSSSINQIDIPITSKLAKFQREGVEFIISKNGRALIADEMGLGKSSIYNVVNAIFICF
jgi:SWI/SNF-related matrix-associated actin-dependent regulator 1 of chromatin subfamily A